MITKEDIVLLTNYLNEINDLSDELSALNEKLNLMRTIQEAQDELMTLVKEKGE